MFAPSRIPLTRMLDCLAMAVGFFIAGCGALPTAGPTASQIVSQQTEDKQSQFALIDIDDRVVDSVLDAPRENFRSRFSHTDAPVEPKIGVGDSLVVTIWEAAGGGLFASTATDQVTPGSRSIALPEQVVGRDGAISVPFAGRIPVAGRLPVDVQHAIEQRLAGNAIDPQVIVTVGKSVNNTVTVTGEAIGGSSGTAIA